MHAHPDADAFIRSILRDPADVTTRLVFADWLEETGEPANVAWAQFIRLKAEAALHALRSVEHRAAERRASEIAPHLQARLTVSAALFVSATESFFLLLPAERFTIRIGNFRPSHEAVGAVDEEIARSIPVLPLDYAAGQLIVVHPAPVDARAAASVRTRLPNSTIVVGGDWEEIVRTLHPVYADAHARAEAWAQIVADLPTAFETIPGTYEVRDASDFVDDVLAAGARRGADLISLIPDGEVVRVFYRTPGGSDEAGRISRDAWRHRVFPEIIRRGEASGCEFTVEVVRVRNSGERAVRIWPLPLMTL